MTKQELTRNIESRVGNSFPTLSDIARYLGVGRDSARELVKDLDYFDAGRAKKYYAGDVADRIMKQRGM